MPGRRTTLIAALLFLELVLAGPARADAGTPLMWAGLAHLVAGNAIIGIGEGLLLAWLFALEPFRAMPIMVLANYLSMIAGLVVLSAVAGPLTDQVTLYTAPRILASLTLLSYLLTILLEWPFCFWLMQGKKRRAARSFRASIAAQTASYALLIPFYLANSGITLYTHLRMDSTLASDTSAPAAVYFISPAGDVCRMQPDGTGRQIVLAAQIRSTDARLFLRPHPGPNRSDLWVAGYPSDESRTCLIRDIVGRAAPPSDKDRPGREPGTWLNLGPAADLQGSGGEPWKVWTGFWPYEGLHAENSRTHTELTAALEAPFVRWISRNATVLPGGQVIYQLGDQIVLLDLRSRRIRLAARGRGPVVVLTQSTRSARDQQAN